MDLIEKLGGYEEAKKIRVAFDATHYCISRKSQMKMFSVGVIGSATIAHSIACGFKETKLKDDDLVTQKQIDRALLQYRREHSLFEVGDLVTHLTTRDILKVISIEDSNKHYRFIKVKAINPENQESVNEFNSLWFQLKHATDEEIEVGRRLND